MIQAASESGIDAISPIARNSKHQTTPSRLRRKFSRKDQGADIHSTCSTPNRMQAEAPSSSFSPSDAFPCSQENRPEVVWDYTSPNLPKGASKKELKITVDEFLKNLTQHQAPECNTQSSRYIKLLEKWMAKQNTPVCVKKPLKSVKRDSKVRSRRLYEDIQKLITSIQHEKNVQTEENHSKENSEEINAPVNENNQAACSSPNQLENSISKKSFLEGESNDNDSMEELWGETDNSFIIKATQHLDVSSPSFVVKNNNYDIVSTIPETATGASYQTKSLSEIEQPTNKNSLNRAMLDSDYQAQILLSQVMNCNWESDSENEDWEKGFIMGDDDLSLIPDEILCGAESASNTEKDEDNKGPAKSTSQEVVCNKISTNSKEAVNDRLSCELAFDRSEADTVAIQAVEQSDIELFNNFEDESFGDESILCKPEVLSWIDEVESKLSQSQKCTPEEIEKKKDEAIQRKKRNQQRH